MNSELFFFSENVYFWTCWKDLEAVKGEVLLPLVGKLLFSTKKYQDSLGKWQVPALGQEVQKISLISCAWKCGVTSPQLQGAPTSWGWRVQFEYQRPEWPYQVSKQMIIKTFWSPGSPTCSKIKVVILLIYLSCIEWFSGKPNFLKNLSKSYKYRKNGWITELPFLLSLD